MSSLLLEYVVNMTDMSVSVTVSCPQGNVVSLWYFIAFCNFCVLTHTICVKIHNSCLSVNCIHQDIRTGNVLNLWSVVRLVVS